MGFKSRNEPITDEDNEGVGLFWGIVLIVFSIFWIAFTWFGIQNNLDEVETITKEQLYREIEGSVENFIPQNSEGVYPKEETFTIKNIPFKYSSHLVTVGYNKPKHKGGVIDTGKYVRIHYYDGMILRLWVWEEKKK